MELILFPVSSDQSPFHPADPNQIDPIEVADTNMIFDLGIHNMVCACWKGFVFAEIFFSFGKISR